MQSDRTTKRKNRDDSTGAAKHDCEASDDLNQSQSMVGMPRCGVQDSAELCRYLFGTRTPLPSSRYSVEPTREI